MSPACGPVVGVVATGFAVRHDLLERGMRRLRAMGYTVEPAVGVRARRGYLAGHDSERAAGLQQMIDRADVDAIWFARGGYGTARILEQVPWKKLARRPKLLIGYSDLTALFAAAVDRAGVRCLYGPVVAELGESRRYDLASLEAALAGRPAPVDFGPRQVLVRGRGRGRLVGGNLTVLAHLLGTPFAPNLRDAVLFLEEVGEELYRVDRCLTQLRAAGKLDGLRGVLLGGFAVPPTRRSFPPDRRLRDVLLETFEPLGVPVVRGLRAGHVARKLTLPLGATASIDTARGRVRFLP